MLRERCFRECGGIMSNNLKPEELKSKRRNISLSDQEVAEIYGLAFPGDEYSMVCNTLSEAIRKIKEMAWKYESVSR